MSAANGEVWKDKMAMWDWLRREGGQRAVNIVQDACNQRNQTVTAVDFYNRPCICSDIVCAVAALLVLA